MSNMLPYEYPAFLDWLANQCSHQDLQKKEHKYYPVTMLILNILIVSNNQTVCFICITLCEKLKEAATEYKSHV